MMLQRNMSLIDMVFRTLMGISLIYFGPFSDLITNDTLSSVLLSTVGIVIIISSLIGWCPFYHFAGISTYRKINDSN